MMDRHGKGPGAREEIPNGMPASMPDWNAQADFYNAFAFCELEDTEKFIDQIGLKNSDTLLDVCCGPGRASVVAAPRCRKVTGIDSASRMLDYAKANAEERGLDNVEFRLMDWECVLPGQNLEKHDVVYSARNGSMMEVEKLSSLANRTVAIQIFANSPSLPALLGVLFAGCNEKPGDCRPGKDIPGRHGGMMGRESMLIREPEGGPMGDGPIVRTESVYMKIVQKVYAAGYDPNLRIMPERFRKRFANCDEAIDWICTLEPRRAEGNRDRIAINAGPFLRDVEDGVEFCIATSAAIIWWNVAGASCFHVNELD